VSAPDEAFWADVPFGAGVKRITVDANGLAALDKPEGVLSHPNGARDEARSLVRARYDEAEECFSWTGAGGQARRLWLINRLDSATSGLILMATTGELAREVRAQFKRRQVSKTYQALVFGKPRQKAETWTDILEVRKLGGKIRTQAGSGRLPAQSRMTLVRAGDGATRVSLIRLDPQTGRSHQLRVQCAKRGMPIVGDQTYGNFAANRAFARENGSKRMFLHSMETSFEYSYGGRENSFSAVAPLPPEFKRQD
jgi:23S rRNA-/tRNA-specific pseudouridylate synthase